MGILEDCEVFKFDMNGTINENIQELWPKLFNYMIRERRPIFQEEVMAKILQSLPPYWRNLPGIADAKDIREFIKLLIEEDFREKIKKIRKKANMADGFHGNHWMTKIWTTISDNPGRSNSNIPNLAPEGLTITYSEWIDMMSGIAEWTPQLPIYQPQFALVYKNTVPNNWQREDSNIIFSTRQIWRNSFPIILVEPPDLGNWAPTDDSGWDADTEESNYIRFDYSVDEDDDYYSDESDIDEDDDYYSDESD